MRRVSCMPGGLPCLSRSICLSLYLSLYVCVSVSVSLPLSFHYVCRLAPSMCVFVRFPRRKFFLRLVRCPIPPVARLNCDLLFFFCFFLRLVYLFLIRRARNTTRNEALRENIDRLIEQVCEWVCVSSPVCEICSFFSIFRVVLASSRSVVSTRLRSCVCVCTTSLGSDGSREKKEKEKTWRVALRDKLGRRFLEQTRSTRRKSPALFHRTLFFFSSNTVPFRRTLLAGGGDGRGRGRASCCCVHGVYQRDCHTRR